MIRVVAIAVVLSSTFATQALAGAKDDMLATDKAFSEMSVAKGAHAAFLAYMADDVLEYDGDHPPLVGKVAVAAYYADQDKKTAGAAPSAWNGRPSAPKPRPTARSATHAETGS